ncbi:siderophore ABC transporter substrate-binding protein [Bacillus suaedae]|uniref:Siderophore ABC transporter substrate-binding protein n=1 Tax=Halalkalibacter suaedae TaxID=2822140 RepID=A0A940WVH0_9BACI|nr:siderophore ABC transporter substrate-binding protein [Bacillus suaedae]MBP3953011.1 siderophore ABC transporter substrate-binding protein [Bacillus suaedae]
MGKFKLTIVLAIFILILAACGSSDDTSGETEATEPEVSETETAETEEATEPTTVEITDAHGTVTVPVNPKNVVALDNRTFETLEDWGIELAAVPKPLMLADSSYVADENVQDVGMHREPNLEIIAAADPELVIVGQRFSGYYEDIKKLVPNAAVIDLNVDVETSDPGDKLVNGFKDTTIALGQIFDKNEEAEQLVADLDQAIEDAKAAYNGSDTIMSVIVSGGDIGFSAPNTGRVFGPLYDIFEWTPALEVEDTSTDHQGDEISVEAIAQSNPDWIFVLDRDAPISGIAADEKVPAQDVIDNSPALQNTTAVSEGQIVYAPIDTYINESIQTFTELFTNIADTLAE